MTRFLLWNNAWAKTKVRKVTVIQRFHYRRPDKRVLRHNLICCKARQRIRRSYYTRINRTFKQSRTDIFISIIWSLLPVWLASIIYINRLQICTAYRLLLFSDITWASCNEHELIEFILHHNFSATKLAKTCVYSMPPGRNYILSQRIVLYILTSLASLTASQLMLFNSISHGVPDSHRKTYVYIHYLLCIHNIII